MSLVRSVSLFGSHDLYSLKDGNDSSGLATSMYDSDNRRMIYPCESDSSDSFDPKYFLDSPSEGLAPTSSSDVMETPFSLPRSSSYHLMAGKNSFISPLVTSRSHAYQFSYELEDLYSPSPDVINYDEDKVRLKLQELEKALLDDNAANNDDIKNRDHCMEIDDEWSDPTTRYTLLHDSPKESSSSDSNLSRISCRKEISVVTQTPKTLLFECAASINSGYIEEATCMINMLRQRVSIQGDPSERIAAYMVEALAARIATSGSGLYKVLKCKDPSPSLDRLSAMQVLFEVCPCFRFGFMAANAAILEAFNDEKRVHIIDFDVNQGSQYYTLLTSLAKLSGKRPHVRLTGVDDPESIQRAVGGLKNIGQRLELLAKDLQLSFEFQIVAAETALISPSMLGCQPGEALIVNFAFQLHHLPDESVSTVNLRDQLLRMVKGLNPKVVTIVEQDMNTNTAPFLPRFAEAYNYYSAVFESLDAALARDSQDRINVEKQCLARDIINVVACEGEERIERYELSGKWRARMNMAGFTSCPIGRNINNEIRKLIKQYSDRYKVKEEVGALHFGWEDKILIVSSAWR